LALTSPTGGGRSVGIVRSRTNAMEVSLVSSAHVCVEYWAWSTLWGIRKVDTGFL
jgi:hypothetical protein